MAGGSRRGTPHCRSGARRWASRARRAWAHQAAPAQHTATRARGHTRVRAHGAHSNTQFHCTAHARHMHILAPARSHVHLAGARAGAAGVTGHDTAGRHRRSGIEGRREVHNHLNMMLQGALQLLCNLWTRTLPGENRRGAPRGMLQSCLESHACAAAASERAPAPLKSARRSDLFKLPCYMSRCEHAAC